MACFTTCSFPHLSVDFGSPTSPGKLVGIKMFIVRNIITRFRDSSFDKALLNVRIVFRVIQSFFYLIYYIKELIYNAGRTKLIRTKVYFTPSCFISFFFSFLLMELSMRQLTCPLYEGGCLQPYDLATSYVAHKLLLIPREFASSLLNKSAVPSLLQRW